MKINKNALFIACLIVIGFIVYANSLPNSFVWDDEEQIVNNVLIRDWKNFPLIFKSSTFYGGGEALTGGFYRPWVTFSYFLNYSIWGLNPVGFRLFQIFFHILNLVLIFFILRKIFSGQKIKYSSEISFLAALLWVLHPTNVEAVAYVASIGEVLYTFFGLLAILIFLRKIDYQNKDIKNKFLLWVFLFIFLALFAKETAIIVFVILFFYLLIFLKPNLCFYGKYLLGTAITLGIYSIFRFGIAKISAAPNFPAPIGEAPLFQRFLTIPYEILSYFKIIFFPKVLSVSRHFVITDPADIKFAGALIFLLIIFIIGALLFWKKKSKISVFFVLWFFFSIGPALNIIPASMTVAERWLYFPIIGILAFLSYLIFQTLELLNKKWQKIILLLFIFLIIFVLGLRTIIRNSDWKNELALYGHDIKYTKNSYELENNYGVALFRKGKISEASVYFEKSIELQPAWMISRNNLGAVYEREGEFEKAIKEYKESMKYGDYYLAYENLANLFFKTKKIDEAREFLKTAVLKFTRSAKLKTMLAVILYIDGDTSTAKSLIYSILEDDPQNQKAIELLGDFRRGDKIRISP